MAKKNFLKTFLIFVGVAILLIFLVGFYFYNYHVFEVVEVCVGDYQEINKSCESVDDCLKLFENYEENFNETDFSDFGDYGNVSDLPNFAKEKLFEFSDELVFCDGVCKVRSIDGIDSDYLENEIPEDCSENGKIISTEIRGKDALEIFRFLKK